jgi:hypothetical protein
MFERRSHHHCFGILFNQPIQNFLMQHRDTSVRIPPATPRRTNLLRSA